VWNTISLVFLKKKIGQSHYAIITIPAIDLLPYKCWWHKEIQTSKSMDSVHGVVVLSDSYTIFHHHSIMHLFSPPPPLIISKECNTNRTSRLWPLEIIFPIHLEYFFLNKGHIVQCFKLNIQTPPKLHTFRTVVSFVKLFMHQGAFSPVHLVMRHIAMGVGGRVPHDLKGPWC
jgi:hypothetical protein